MVDFKIIGFIEARWMKYADTFLTGNCYWFARILQERFPHLKIYYSPVSGHFFAGDGKCFYDARGSHRPEKPFYSLDTIKEEDPIWYERLLKNCRD